MLDRIIDLSLRYRPIVLLATALLILSGIASFMRLPFDAFPDTTPVQVQINTTAPALSPLEVERQITFEVEQAIAGMPGLRNVRSVSKFGLSQVTATFDDDTGIYLARQLLSERLQGVELPVGVVRPSLGPLSTGLGEVFQYVLRSDTLSAEELRTLHHWVIRPQLLRVPGVAEINTWGGYERQYHVVIEPSRLTKFGLTLDDLARALREGNRNVGGGAFDSAGEAYLVQGQGVVGGVRDIARMVVASSNGVPIHVEDVADVRVGHAIRRGAATADGRGEVVLGLGFMLMGENSHELTQRLQQRLEVAKGSLPPGAELVPMYERSDLVDKVLHTVRNNLLEGALLVIAVLFIFLGNVRAGLIVALAIPLSVLFAFNAMLRFGIAGSLMSLGAIDFGLVVDSSVIVVENAARRLSEAPSDKDVREAVKEATSEVRRPTLFGELIIAAVYLPVLTLEGVEGKLFRPMALTVIFALVGSMILSMTLTPVLASYALRAGHRERETRLVRWLKRGYAGLLERALRWPLAVLTAALLIAAGAVYPGAHLGSEFVPRLREQSVVINTIRVAGVSLEESVRYGTRIERLLKQEFPGEIEHVWTRTGTAEVATDPMGLELSDVFITLTPREQWQRASNQDELMAEMAKTLEGLPGMKSVFTQPIEMRVNEMTAGIRADVGIKLYGDDFEQLKASAEEIRAAVEAVPNAADVTVEQLTGQPMLVVAVDREAAGRYGVPTADILEVVESLGRRKLGEVIEGQRRFDLVLRLSEPDSEAVQGIRDLLIRTESGAQVRLGTVAKVDVVEGPSTVQREWGRRRIVVQANVRGRDLGSFVEDVRSALDEKVTLPPGYTMDLGGQFEHLQRAERRLMLVVPLTLLVIFGLLYLTYGRALDAARVFLGVPFGVVGGVMALWLRGMPFSISAWVGFIALSGVAVLGDMVLVSRVRQLRKAGVPRREAILQAATTRLRPVLITAAVAAVGFVPMALSDGVGAEVQRPLATVVIGGMVTATFATLIVLPVLYSLGRKNGDPGPASQ
ncbi:MAG: efflux RND transporter permease subunit [Polyangiaceae bacterium]|nr:efflux RND transporter permease subunit [Myxococcales bacterium]MCB9589384.1 efflux RND transporter permease subunit [Polyangiaceae bacterium]